ncbi:MAG TPA: AAA family ATPase [Segetibacter sp.]
MVNQVNRVVTFYSYKGGVGRSMALANVAVILAQWGYKTLMIDWDLEAPGLENYYREYLDVNEVMKHKGLINLLNLKLDDPSISVDRINWEDYIIPVSVNKNVNLHLMTAGKRDEHYIKNIRQFDFTSFYSENEGGQFLEDLRDHWLNKYNFILIDSRTGLTDSSGICSIHMPDILVLFFTPNVQSFNGIKEVAAKAIAGQKQVIFDRFKLRTVPIPSRIENAETSLLDEWMKKISEESDEMLDWLPRKEENVNEFIVAPGQFINQMKIPYKTLYAYGERLAAIERGTSDPQDLGYVYETIAGVIANDLQNIHLLNSSRDNLVKKAKGEDIIDHSELQRKVVHEQLEKSKLEEEKMILEQKLLHKKKQGKKSILIVSAIAVIVIAALFLFKPFSNNSEIIVRDVPLADSFYEAKAYIDFVSRYNNSNEQESFAFNLAMIKQYHSLNQEFRDSLKDIRETIELRVSDKLTRLTDSFYLALRTDPAMAQQYLADSLSKFGKWTNVTKGYIQNNISAFTKTNKITNKTIAETVFVTSDSAGFKVGYAETGNVLLDELTPYKSVSNYDTIAFDDYLKIKSLRYKTASIVPKIKIEVFFCSGNDAKMVAKGNDIIQKLATSNDYTVAARNNFNPSTNPSSPYYITSNQIRYNGRNEEQMAKKIQKLLSSLKVNAVPLEARTATPNYISVFICPQETIIEDIKVNKRAAKY